MLNLDVKKLCSYCDKSPLRYPVQPHCGAFQCKMEWSKEKEHKVNDYWSSRNVKHQKKIQGMVEQWGNDKNIPVEDIVLIEIPNCNASIETVSDERKDVFEEHLNALISDLENTDEEKLFKPRITPHKNTGVANMLGSMCALCNGKCCNKGGTRNAFIQRSTLKRVIERVDEVSKDNVVEIYMQHIPKKSTGGSCLFHTDKGCCLSSELRANICGEFFCLNLSGFIDSYHKKPAPKHSMVVSTHECEIRKVSVFEASDEGLEIVPLM